MKILIVANWKCNPTTLAEAKLLFESVKRGIKNLKNVEVVICPPFIYLSNLLTPKPYTLLYPKLGAQDCFWEEKGAFTGEISPLMLKNLGCEYIIIGHSERRKLGETDEMINKKLKSALKAKLKPILCIGETLEERKKGKTFIVLKNQLKKALINSSTHQLINLILAYEPVWAIGTGKPCGISEAKEANLFIKKIVKNIPLLYGGSINSKIAKDYIQEANFQGLLVGSASLNPKEFIKIIKSVARS
jgi:triosephosphate isomerase